MRIIKVQKSKIGGILGWSPSPPCKIASPHNKLSHPLGSTSCHPPTIACTLQ